MKLFIVTGSSRGMGEAIARQLLAPDHFVLGIARRCSEALAAAALQDGAGLEQWSCDLADPLPVAEQLRAWLAEQAPGRFCEAVLINNAGVVTEPGPIDSVPLALLSGALRVGLEATLLLSSAFLGATRGWAAPKKILNISSGLGRRAMAASAPYCAAKAGMDNLSGALALDEAQRPDGARVVSLAPGVIDTDMQVQLRSGDPARFPDQQRFAALKREGLLDSPEQAAAKVLRYLARPDFGSKVLADVRDA
ncbi:MAG TPA: SDR family NAD(P)-dependent oxidoreductase [Roseateles sp.]|nr:SDR family NAD(P)-dependent oxidoreductase [Roseateles sp.]